MLSIFSAFNHSDWIQLFAIITSLLICIISICVAIATLKQNSKMIEESTRPYIDVYGDYTNINGVRFYLILKNFGQTAAYISEFSCSCNLEKIIDMNDPRNPFEHIVNVHLAPNQSIRAAIDVSKCIDDFQIIQFNFKYRSFKKEYTEQVIFNFKYTKDISSNRAICKDNGLNIIGQALQDIAEKQL